MTIQTTATDLTITGAEPPIATLEIDKQLIDFTTYDGTLASVTDGTPYTLALDGFSAQDDAFFPLLSDAYGAYLYAGQELPLRYGRAISIDSGAYTVSGDGIKLSANRAITLEQGSYTYTGSPITLSYSGELIALITGYSVNYAQDDVSAKYENDYITARFQ